MPQIPPLPEPFRPGDDLPSSRKLNEIVRAVVRQIRGGRNTTVGYFGDRVTVESQSLTPTLPAAENYIQQFVVLQEYDDYLKCAAFYQPVNVEGTAWIPQEYDPTLGIGSTDITYIAKPYELQKSPWQGQPIPDSSPTVYYAYTSPGSFRLAVDSPGGAIVHGYAQKIRTPYTAGDLICACRSITGLVGLDNLPILWTDANTAARTWQGIHPIFCTQSVKSQYPVAYNLSATDLSLAFSTDTSSGFTFDGNGRPIIEGGHNGAAFLAIFNAWFSVRASTGPLPQGWIQPVLQTTSGFYYQTASDYISIGTLYNVDPIGVSISMYLFAPPGSTSPLYTTVNAQLLILSGAQIMLVGAPPFVSTLSVTRIMPSLLDGGFP